MQQLCAVSKNVSYVSYCYQFLFQLHVRVEHVPHFCLYTTGEETFAIYNLIKENLHCTASINTDLKIL